MCFQFPISVHLHIGDVLENKGLVKLWVEILPVHFSLILRLLVRKQIHLNKRISETSGPVSWWKIRALQNLKKDETFLVLQRPQLLLLLFKAAGWTYWDMSRWRSIKEREEWKKYQ